MRIRGLGLRAQELEAGPYRFLLSDSIPVAYTDGATWYKTVQYFDKATTKRLNRWFHDKASGMPVASVPQSEIVSVFESVSRFSQPDQVEERRQSSRRERDQMPPTVMRLAEALVDALANGKR